MGLSSSGELNFNHYTFSKPLIVHYTPGNALSNGEQGRQKSLLSFRSDPCEGRKETSTNMCKQMNKSELSEDEKGCSDNTRGSVFQRLGTYGDKVVREGSP